MPKLIVTAVSFRARDISFTLEFAIKNENDDGNYRNRS